MTTPNNQFLTQTGFPQGGNEDYDFFGYSLAAGDFNGDGYGDLSIGTPYEDIGGLTNTGKVNIANGSYWGLTTTNSQIWEQDAFPNGGNEDFDNFGYSLVTGDFNGDGYKDLAIGTPQEDLDGMTDSGKVNILEGSYWGLTSSNSQLWKQDAFPSGGNEDYDNFGQSLASGDFNGDGYDDLAIGTPKEDLDGMTDSGKVNVLEGSYWGLTSSNSQLWKQDAFPSGGNEDYDNFGQTLASGDFNGDGYDDLAIGTPQEDLDGMTDSGKVNVLHGSYYGLTSTDSQLWTQDAFPSGGNEDYDNFGQSLATGDFNGDGYDDLAIGTPQEDLDGMTDSGKVNVLHGSYWGLTSTDSQLWTQDAFPSGGNESYDNFGNTLATGDFNGDGYDDLAIGTQYEDIDGMTNVGKVNVLEGSYWGLTSSNSQLWTQDSFGVEGIAEEYDNFGSSLTVDDFNGDGYDDLAIGVSGESIGSISSSGAMNILYGSANGLTV